ncbi:dihydrofolate reductase [Leifsonia sp. YIM 134122]|uniref:dihydrofolate reductase n=1 Tax=Leifsonia stereocauli TaxID=3134136 RepID=A0ABU9W2R1_9MICO
MTDAAARGAGDVADSAAGVAASAAEAGALSADAAAGSAASVSLGLIWAQSSDGTIGRDGVMPWHLPEDLAHFKQVTLGAPVVMGRKTWDSLPPRFRPLAGRRNIVLTRQHDWSADGAEVAHSIPDALDLAAEPAPAPAPGSPDAASVAATPERIWVIGGAELFAAVIDQADVLEVTEIDASFPGDTQAPLIAPTWALAAADPASDAPLIWHTSRAGLQYRFLTYARR